MSKVKTTHIVFDEKEINMKQIFSKKTKGPDKAYPICMDSIQGTEGPKADWNEGADDKLDRCVEKVKNDNKKKSKESKSPKEASKKKEKDPCWKGYKQVGMKNKDGKEVPNCVPNNKKSNTIFDVFKKKVAQIEDSMQEEYGLNDNELAEKIQEFEKLVAGHDITYQYSDDNRYYSAGRQQFAQIIDLADQLKELGAYDQAQRIWNANVDQKLVPNAREQFYWR